MKFREKRGWAVLGILCALLTVLVSGDARACTTCAVASLATVGADTCPPACECPSCPTQALTGPALFADFKVAGAVPGTQWGDAVPVVEGKFTLANALGPINLNVGARHFASHDDYWRSKARMAAGFDVPLAPECKFFGEFRRHYYTGDEWTWAGLAFKFGPK